MSLSQWPTLLTAIVAVFLIQWAVFIPSFVYKTEKYFDLTGALTYISVTIGLLVLTPDLDARSMILGTLVIIWAARLGSFLFLRIRKDGADDRFDEIKPNFARFLMVWTLQGVWITLTALAAWMVIAASADSPLANNAGIGDTGARAPFGWISILGLALWVFAFCFEVIADMQKRQFRKNPANKGKFIHTGLWALSRHPNYFGEITMWIAVFIIAAPVLSGWMWIAILSPISVWALIRFASGVPGLEKKADKRWGGQPEYEEYKASTPVIFPAFWK